MTATACPNCGKGTEVDDGTLVCHACGARALPNPESGNRIWMIRGRVIAADDDLQEHIQTGTHNYKEMTDARSE